jgi:SAM-dependent methyltransferase
VRAFNGRRHDGDTPLPPRRLRATVGSPGAAAYLRGGRAVAEELVAALARAGYKPDAFERVLDLGCGTGRVMFPARSWFPSVVGCDVDEAAIAWASQRDQGVFANSYQPPLPFTDHEFDLVYAVSVFTHLPTDLQDPWLADVARVLRPGGVALVTTQGPYFHWLMRCGTALGVRTDMLERLREPPFVEEAGFLYYSYDTNRIDPANPIREHGDYGLAFHSPSFIRAQWTRHFDVLDVEEEAINHGHDLVILRKR